MKEMNVCYQNQGDYQLPYITTKDPNDEPASVLLERIRVEKEELIKQGKIKRAREVILLLQSRKIPVHYTST